MKIIHRQLLLLVWMPFLVSGQTKINGGRAITGTWDASGARSTQPARKGTGAPGAPCSSGEVYFRTDAATGQNLYFCAPDNIWNQMSGGSAGGGGGGAPTGAKYILQSPDSNLPNAQSLSSLDTGLLKSTTGTGALSIALSSDLPISGDGTIAYQTDTGVLSCPTCITSTTAASGDLSGTFPNLTISSTTGAGAFVRAANPALTSYFDISQIAAPSAPAAGKLRVYAKTGAGICWKDSGGGETCVGAGGGGSVAWADIMGKPSTFTPSTHTHSISEVTSLQTALDSKRSDIMDFTVFEVRDDFLPRNGVGGLGSQLPWQFAGMGTVSQGDEVPVDGYGSATRLGTRTATPTADDYATLRLSYSGRGPILRIAQDGTFNDWDMRTLVWLDKPAGTAAIANLGFWFGWNSVNTQPFDSGSRGATIWASTGSFIPCTVGGGAYTATNFVYSARSNTGAVCVDSGVPAMSNTKYLLRIWSPAPGIIKFSINGANEGTISSADYSGYMPTGASQEPALGVKTYTTAQKTFDIQRFALRVTGLLQ